MSTDRRARTGALRIAVGVAGAVVGLALAGEAVLFVLHGHRWFVRQGYPEAAALALGVSEIAAGVFFAVPRTRLFGAAALMGVLGWAAGFHFAVRQATGGLFLWMAAVASIALMGWWAGRKAVA